MADLPNPENSMAHADARQKFIDGFVIGFYAGASPNTIVRADEDWTPPEELAKDAWDSVCKTGM